MIPVRSQCYNLPRQYPPSGRAWISLSARHVGLFTPGRGLCDAVVEVGPLEIAENQPLNKPQQLPG